MPIAFAIPILDVERSETPKAKGFLLSGFATLQGVGSRVIWIWQYLIIEGFLSNTWRFTMLELCFADRKLVSFWHVELLSVS